MENKKYSILPAQKIGLVALTFFLLFAGFGRIFNVVLHDPVIAYANSYDMIPLQACHQIWPAVRGVDIRKGSPAAPLRPYSISQHVDTPCMPSSELLFTGLAIKLASMKGLVKGEKLISIKSIGLVKAVFLVLTALFFHLFLVSQRQFRAMFLNAVVVFLVLADPGVTLYLSTFYTQFSAVYFLYLLMGGIAVLHWYRRHYFFSGAVLLCAGLLGLALSMPQHAVLAVIIGAVLAAYYFKKKSPFVAAAALVFSIIPYGLQSGEYLAQHNARLDFSNQTNVFSAVFDMSPDQQQAAAILKLPASCVALAGKKSYDGDLITHHPCEEIRQVSHWNLAMLLAVQPSVLVKMTNKMMPAMARWTIDNYGQIEGEKFTSVISYCWSLLAVTRLIPHVLLPWIFCAPAIIWLLVVLSIKARGKSLAAAEYFSGLLIIVQWSALLIALLSFGLVDVIKNAHLAALMTAVNVVGLFFFFNRRREAS